MRWLVFFLAPLILWAGAFSAVYGLHGLGCAWGWPFVATPLGSLHVVGMVAVWLAALGLHFILLRAAPRGPALTDRLVRLAGWIGIWSTLLTLWPVLLVSSCDIPV
ncbi:MAG: hypothetical protein Q7J44_15350 [Pseudotabrizicola sp.]|uniref:hypothetical protein n=1 Tax=Pseudotabrizicola sp. TaxID=2939647 RepID=UPI0027182868|nr:hypothetical protein [Pseudotabrizicola sp.]MDO9639913.1 hypothetical protein [Pseudotabrizicola sp.]